MDPVANPYRPGAGRRPPLLAGREALLESFDVIRGRAEEARRILIRHGTKKFGPPDEQAKTHIAALTDLERLQDLIDRVLDVASWDELLTASNS